MEQPRDDCGEDLSSIACLAEQPDEQSGAELFADGTVFTQWVPCLTTAVLA